MEICKQGEVPYYTASAVELAVGVLENIFLHLGNNQAHSWLTIAHAGPSPSPV